MKHSIRSTVVEIKEFFSNHSRRVFMKFVYEACLVLMCIFAVQLSFAQGQSSVDTSFVSVVITSPNKDNAEVNCEIDVNGNANLKTGQYLWVLTHRTKGFEDMWWPQNVAKINPKNNTWKCHVVFGGRQDIGYKFEIAAIIVNEEYNIILKDYRKNAMRTGDWRPIEMPETMAPPVIREVKKISHDGCN
jgi:hypothetical protein